MTIIVVVGNKHISDRGNIFYIDWLYCLDILVQYTYCGKNEMTQFYYLIHQEKLFGLLIPLDQAAN